jgi:hypothetical protein
MSAASLQAMQAGGAMRSLDSGGLFDVNRLPGMRGGREIDALATRREPIVRRLPRMQVDRAQEQHKPQKAVCPKAPPTPSEEASLHSHHQRS